MRIAGGYFIERALRRIAELQQIDAERAKPRIGARHGNDDPDARREERTARSDAERPRGNRDAEAPARCAARGNGKSHGRLPRWCGAVARGFENLRVLCAV